MEGQETCLYFAFGSMCNPVSLSRRGIHPLGRSLPATITGYTLVFTYGGMANLAAVHSGRVHGILHEVTVDQFKVLCDIESGYDVVTVTATPYEPYSINGTNIANGSSTSSKPGSALSPVQARAFMIDSEKLAQLKKLHTDWDKNLVPTERYITIITQGLQHFGADPSWVQHMLSHPFKPDKTADQYLKAAVPENADQLPVWTEQQLAEHQGKIDNQRVVMGCGPKVLQVDFSSNAAVPFVETMRDRMSGRNIAFSLCQLLFNPKLPPLNSPADVRDAHIAFAEDATVEWTRLQGMTVTQIGWLEQQAQGQQ